MTGFDSKRRVAQDKLTDDDAQGYIAEYEAALLVAYQRGFADGKRSAQPKQQAEPVLLECVTCGTVYAEGVPPQVPVRGPVAYMHKETGLLRREIGRPKGADWDANYWEPLYTTPPAAPRKSLTDEMVHQAMIAINTASCGELQPTVEEMKAAIEAAHNIKEGT